MKTSYVRSLPCSFSTDWVDFSEHGNVESQVLRTVESTRWKDPETLFAGGPPANQEPILAFM